MFTAILTYYALCAVGLGASAAVLDHSSGSSSSSDYSGSDDYPSYRDNLGADGEPLGMPYMP